MKHIGHASIIITIYDSATQEKIHAQLVMNL